MTRIERIHADLIRADPPNPRHPRSMKNGRACATAPQRKESSVMEGQATGAAPARYVPGHPPFLGRSCSHDSHLVVCCGSHVARLQAEAATVPWEVQDTFPTSIDVPRRATGAG